MFIAIIMIIVAAFLISFVTVWYWAAKAPSVPQCYGEESPEHCDPCSLEGSGRSDSPAAERSEDRI